MGRRGAWDLQDKVVVVTGGAGGIAAATAVELRRRGARIALVDVNETAVTEAAARLGDDVVAVTADVTDFAACERAISTVVDRYGRIDVVWANAGIGIGGPVELVDPAAWARVVQVNLIGAFNTVRAALPAVIASRGHVAITASLASFAHAPLLSAYAASKAGVEAFADALRVEVAHQGVTVGTLHPTWIDTDMVREGDTESAAFARLRKTLRPPFARTYPVEAIVPDIVDGIAARSSRLFLPGFVRLAFRVRNTVNSRVSQFEQVRAMPEMRRLFLESVADKGAHVASFGTRWSSKED